MSYRQVRPFNQALAGSTPLRCLANTRKGYGIGAKYPTAWEAWLHTQQHPNRDFPALDIPLYYSFTHTISGVRKNYGHINVRLANGRVWSDGKLFQSLTAFEQAFSNVHFLGWGESINDIKIVEYSGGDMELSPDDIDRLVKGMLGREPTAEELGNPDWAKDASLAVNALWNNGGEQRYKDSQNPPEYVETKVYVKR